LSPKFFQCQNTPKRKKLKITNSNRPQKVGEQSFGLEATDDMLARTAYEKQAADCRKAGTPLPRKPRRRMPKVPRREFPWDVTPPALPVREPLVPPSDPAIGQPAPPCFQPKTTPPT